MVKLTYSNNQSTDFDWDSIGKRDTIYKEEEKKKLEELYAKTLSTIAENEVIEGTVVAINNREVAVKYWIQVGRSNYLNEFRYNPI